MARVRLNLSDDQLARAKFELLSFTRGETVSCACLRASGKPYIVFQTNQKIYAMDENAEFWTVQLDDIGLIALDEPPLRLGSGHHLHTLERT